MGTEKMNGEGEVSDLRSFVRAYKSASAREHLSELARRLTEIGYWIYDLQEEQVFWSPELYEIAGVNPKSFALTLRSAVHCYHPDDRKIVIACAEEAAETGCDFDYEVRVVRPTGEIRHVACMGTCEVDDEGNVMSLFAAFQDITERKALLGRLMRTQHLASVGSVATGIAHGVNNPLTSLFVNLELALEELAFLGDPSFDGEMLRDTLEQARDGAEKVRQVVRGLKAFAKEERTRIEPTELRNVAEVALAITQNELRHRCKLETAYEPAPSVLAAPARLEQAVVGLLTNAVQDLGDVPHSEAIIRLEIGEDPNGNALLTLSHNGPSIAQRELEERFRNFEPLPNSGGGLGLAVCHAIVAEDGGELAAEVGEEWTTFRLRFPPASSRSLDESSDFEYDSDSHSAPSARVLVVDDEEIVGNSIKRILPRDEVVVATSGPNALEVLADRGEEAFDVIFCDMMMPGMSGQELFALLEEKYPEAASRVVFVTGGVFADAASSFLARRPNRWLAKPYDVSQIRSIVAGRARKRVASESAESQS